MPRPHKILRANASLFPLSLEERQRYQDGGFELVETEQISTDLVASHGDTRALCVVSAKVTSTMIDHLPNLAVISRFGSGTDNVDVQAASRRRIPVLNVPEFCLAEVADHTLALLLGIARKLVRLDQAMRAGEWRARVTERMRRIEGKQLGLVGFGRIAQEVARRAQPFGLKLAASDPLASDEVFAASGVTRLSFDELLATSDFVSLHVPLTPQTRHLMSGPQFARMKPGAIFLNTARGAVVDEAALVDALRQGHLGGAALDVYEGFDLFGPPVAAPQHPLFDLPNVLLTPHAAACSEESLDELMRYGAANAIAVLQGERPENCVNPEVWRPQQEGAGA